MKSGLILALKLLVGGGLIYWLIDSGKLDLKQLSLFLTDWRVSFVAISYFFLVGVFLGAIRLRILLTGMGYNISIFKLCQFQMIGMFFNTAMPGAVGGDLVKAVYIMKEKSGGSRTKVMATILIDRISGMSGVFAIGLLAAVFNWNALWSNPLIKPSIIFVGSFFTLILVFHFIALRQTEDERDIFHRLLSKNVPGFSILKKIYEAFRAFSKEPHRVIAAFFVSLSIQFTALCYFYFLTIHLDEVFDSFWSLATVLPIGLVTAALPISPGGLGVGHVAFEKLYQIIGSDVGANVFNLYLLGLLVPCLTGIVPYLLTKRKVQISTANMEREAGNGGEA